jgi:hypothetical protein
VAVEKLPRHEIAETASRQDALQTIFPNLLDIFYHPIFDFFRENRLFQQPQGLSPAISECDESGLSRRSQIRVSSLASWARAPNDAFSSELVPTTNRRSGNHVGVANEGQTQRRCCKICCMFRSRLSPDQHEIDQTEGTENIQVDE